MSRVLGFVSALLLRTVSRGSAAEFCRQERNQRPLSWAPFYLSQSSSYRSVCTAPSESVTYQELKQLLKSNTFVIDVREPWEIREYGQIPGSINIPLGQLEQALKLNPSKFMEAYNGKMPSTSDKIVFSCLAGVRSKKALDAAVSMGYSRALHFPGGWEEWVKREFSEKQH
ncbi:thiosulfate sulfurtransferase/rhodanese-like domain-containing protein 3 [Carcharodon carcharias]|uniref:thiosulfate sulfurtransferase/rhodanese-like domain-containing protein 3 n=1 Tax=Carcharodon carcharias TaxID=13397 RepID=UPI001B7E27DB|nr:thiosulfate sulfurtransferase/rhodanese-like domain-containing protein 3 [Carcharodon carcharias]